MANPSSAAHQERHNLAKQNAQGHVITRRWWELKGNQPVMPEKVMQKHQPA
jgi:hypothetical protein